MMTVTESTAPLVSVVVPVYNSVTYLAETLDSLLVQGLTVDELEVVMVDDGSNDGSEAMVDDYAARYSNFRVIHQAQSGSPAKPCNVGAYAARGRYFFILGSDDVMAPNAMADLAGLAEREGSDIVLGKLGSIGGCRTPRAVFARTVYDADLVDNHVFNTLSAVKLFRTDLLRRTGALHPTTLRIGSDQPFVAALYLAANKISICADRDFIFIRAREDGTNITSTRRTPRDYMDLLKLLIPVIVNGTEPGATRDGIMRRPFRNSLTKSLRPSFLRLDESTQLQVIQDLRRVAGPLYNKVTSVHLEPLPRTKVELALDNDLDTLRAVMAWEESGGSAKVAHDGTRFIYDFPSDLAVQIGENRIHSPVVRGEVTLEGVAVSRGSIVELDIRALAAGCRTLAAETLLRLRNRWTGDEVDIPTGLVRELSQSTGVGHVVNARFDLGGYSNGVWDAYIVQCFGDDEIVSRLGARRAEGVSAEPVYLFSRAQEARTVGKLYFTRGPGNLSIDLGFTLTKNELPKVTVRGVVQDGGGGEFAVVHVLSAGIVEFLGPVADGTVVVTPHVALGGDLYAVELPAGSPRHGDARQLVVRSDGEERKSPLPGSTSLGGAEKTGTPGSRSVRREGERATDLFRGAMGDLLVVGRRSVRRAQKEAKSLFRGVLKER
ncbi:hypothetical protein CIK66_01595 [Brachybacterium alimentarium]|uniref:Uncharacterized protein n=1 Tax=Brachybacterium alimentarium TaxID=47845 RepID=A0A2A3YNR2_9MICO|nr:hypothetical protein CIK66_01595 [Brachybacterium alimentarium]